MGIKIDSEKIDASLGVIRNFANDNVVDMIDQLAAVMIPQAGTSELADKVIAQCKVAQKLYNDGGYLDTLNDVIKEFEKVIDIDEWLKTKADVGEVKKIDTGAETGKIDTDAVMA
mgnify:CR=1 FL=1